MKAKLLRCTFSSLRSQFQEGEVYIAEEKDGRWFVYTLNKRFYVLNPKTYEVGFLTRPPIKFEEY